MNKLLKFVSTACPVIIILVIIYSPMQGKILWIEAFDMLSHFATLILFYTISAYISIYVHEFGHALFATIAGIPVKKIQIGIGNPLIDVTVWTLRLVITKPPLGGYVAFDNSPESWIRARFFAAIAGGVLANLIVALMLIWFFGINLFDAPDKSDLAGSAAFMFLIVNLFFFAINLVPLSISTYGFLAHSDGKQLLRVPWLGSIEIADALAAGDIWYGYEKIRENEFSEAEKIFLEITKSFPESALAKINLSTAYIKQLKTSEAKPVLETLDNDQTPEHFRALAWHNLGWICLIEGTDESISLVSDYSDKSLSALPGMSIFKAQKGAALVESGDINDGMRLLRDISLHALSPDIKARATHLAYLIYGYWIQKDMKKVKKLYRKVDEHYEIADADHKMIIDRLRKKSNDFGRGGSDPSDISTPSFL